MMTVSTMLQTQARVFDIQRLSVHDGPGIRTTVFLKGCPLRCAWCQNPESQRPGPQLMLYADLCIGCGACVQVCSQLQALVADDDAVKVAGAALRPAACTACGACAAVCPTEARRIAGQEMTLDALLPLALRDLPFFGEDGGVTFGGGEPLAQWPLVRSLADQLRAEGVHVAVDTSAFATSDIIHDVPDHVDLVLADLKLVSAAAHRRWTGVDNAGILDALRYWSLAMPNRLWISIPLIPGVQDADELQRMADFLAALNGPPSVRLIPYHRLGESKYQALGLPLPTFDAPVEPLLTLAADTFKTRGIRILEQD